MTDGARLGRRAARHCDDFELLAGKSKRRDALAGAQHRGESVAAGDRVAVNDEPPVHDVDDPKLGNCRPRIDWCFLSQVEVPARIGDLDEQQHVAGNRMAVAPFVLVEAHEREIGFGLGAIVHDDGQADPYERPTVEAVREQSGDAGDPAAVRAVMGGTAISSPSSNSTRSSGAKMPASAMRW